MVYNENKGIRDELVKKYGLDNSKIDWDGKNVTYDGKYFMTPTSVSDGKSYAPQTDIQKAVSNYFSNGDIGVRSALTDWGVDTSKLGYNNGIITYDGNYLIKPDRVENGVSYVNNPNDITNAAIQAHKIGGKNIVKAADYVANKQLPFDVGYANGMVSVNGQNLKPVYVADGVAYVDSAELDKVIGNVQNAMGIKDPNQLLEEYMETVDLYYKKYNDLIENREPFEYDYASDPVYQAYKEMYTREGDRVMRDVMGEYAANTGGYVNSAGITAGAQANNYYMQQLGDKIPQLFEAAYGRYNDDYLTKLQGLESIIGQKNDLFEKQYGVNRDILNDIYANNVLNQQRKVTDDNRRLAEKEQEYIDAERQRETDAIKAQNIMTSGRTIGYYTPEQMSFLAQYYGLPEGMPINPYGAEINAAKVENDLASLYAKPSTGYSGKKLDNSSIKTAIGYINEWFKGNEYVEKLIGKADAVRYNPDGSIQWNSKIPEEEKRSFKHPILKEVINNSSLSQEEMKNILISLEINTADPEYDYIFN